jgi:hypothetical protein
MSATRSAGWPRLVSRASVAGLILGGASMAVGLFIVTPIANRSSSDDSPSSIAAIALVSTGLAVTVASAGLWAGGALWDRAHRRR